MTGQHYNAEGILTPWWSPGSQVNFNNKALCFVDQYSRYQVFGMNVSSSNTSSVCNCALYKHRHRKLGGGGGGKGQKGGRGRWGWGT